MATYSTTRPITSFVAAATKHFVKSTIAAFVTWNDERITRKSLSKLSARELEDIGLAYCDIKGIAKRVTR